MVCFVKIPDEEVPLTIVNNDGITEVIGSAKIKSISFFPELNAYSIEIESKINDDAKYIVRGTEVGEFSISESS